MGQLCAWDTGTDSLRSYTLTLEGGVKDTNVTDQGLPSETNLLSLSLSLRTKGVYPINSYIGGQTNSIFMLASNLSV